MFSCQYLLWTKFGKQPAGHCLTAHPEGMIPRHLSHPDDPAVRLSHKGTGRRVEQSGGAGAEDMYPAAASAHICFWDGADGILNLNATTNHILRLRLGKFRGPISRCAF